MSIARYYTCNNSPLGCDGERFGGCAYCKTKDSGRSISIDRSLFEAMTEQEQMQMLLESAMSAENVSVRLAGA